VPNHVRGLASAAAIIFLGSAASRILGLVREQLAAGRFGSGDDIAAFTIADNLNTLLFDLLASGMLQAALAPVLAGLAIAGAAQSSRFRAVTGALALGVGGLSAAVAAMGIVAAPAFVSLLTALTGDRGARGEATRDLAIDCTRIILLSLPLLAVATVLSAGLYAMQRPEGPSIGSACRNAAVVVAIVVAGGAWGVRSMAAGVVAGAAVMCGVQLLALWRAGAMPLASLDLRAPEIERVARLFTPVFLGLVVSAAVVILDRNLAWGAQEEAIGAMRYATSLVQLVLGLTAAAVSLAALPRLSGAFVGGDADAFGRELARALVLVTVLIVPAVFALGALGRPIVRLLFEHGETGPEASRLIWIALLAYLPGHLLAAYDQVLIFAFYARQNTILPVAVGIASSGVYAIAALLLVDRFQMTGLVAANSIQLAFHAIVMLWLGRKVFGTVPLTGLRQVAPPVVASGAVMAVAGWAVYRAGEASLPVQTGAAEQVTEIVLVVLPLGVCGVVYLAVMRWFRVGALDTLLGEVVGRVRVR
jgi:putative peptidoglycan lipid II flippase